MSIPRLTSSSRGAGPAGSTLATFVAMQGHRVLQLERERFPRYQIGESLLPGTVHGICQLLGVDEEVKAAQLHLKRGGTFRWGENPEPWTFTFADPQRHRTGPSGAFQVERMKFDQILLRQRPPQGRRGPRAVPRQRGPRARTAALPGSGTPTRPPGVRRAGRPRAVRRRRLRAHQPTYDHGRRARLLQVLPERGALRLLRGAASGCPRPDSGNILCAAFDAGWFWYIPLSPTLTSVGAVAPGRTAPGDPPARRPGAALRRASSPRAR